MLEGLRQYEISFLTLREADKETVLTTIKENGGEIISEGRYAEQKLAYPINKQTSAFFGSVVFQAKPEQSVSIDKALKFTEGVLRFLTVTPPPSKPAPAFQPKTAEKQVASEVTTSEVVTAEEQETTSI